MAYKVLGQSAPTSNIDTTLYTVPAAKEAVCSTLAIANRDVSTTFRVAVVPSGQTLSNQHYIVFDNTVNQYDSVFLTVGLTLATGDKVIVRAASTAPAGVSFSLFGSELP